MSQKKSIYRCPKCEREFTRKYDLTRHLNRKKPCNINNKTMIEYFQGQLINDKKYKYKSLELCAGCGGLALGLDNSGFRHMLLVDIMKDACNTLKANRPDWNVKCDKLENIDYSNYKNRIDLVAAGLPCQSFSFAGKRGGFEDERGSLFFDFKRCILEVNPRLFLIENVRGLLSHNGGDTLKTIVKIFTKIGYKVYYKVLNANNYNVAQKRERIFIIGVRNDIKEEYKFPEGLSKKLVLKDVLTNINTDDKDLGQEYSESKKKILKMIPEGGCWINLPKDIQKEYLGKSFYSGGGKRGIARKLSMDKPSLTLLTSPQQKQTERCHPKEIRPLTVREYARIQSFPDSWNFTGSVNKRYKQIGNAVPVNLGYHVGKSLVNLLEKIDTTGDTKMSLEKVDNTGDTKKVDNTGDTKMSVDNCDIDIIEDIEDGGNYFEYIDDYKFLEICDNMRLKINKRNKDIKKKIDNNGIDVYKKEIEKIIFNYSEEEWEKAEIQRQVDKTLSNAIGILHEDMFSNIKGWKSYHSKDYYSDIINKDGDIIGEIKNKHNTIKGSDLKKYVKDWNIALDKDKNLTIFLGIVNPKNIEGENCLLKSEGKTYDRLRKITGKKLLEFLTGDINAWDKYMKGIKKAIRELNNQ